jgi:hypothetical protein
MYLRDKTFITIGIVLAYLFGATLGYSFGYHDGKNDGVKWASEVFYKNWLGER